MKLSSFIGIGVVEKDEGSEAFLELSMMLIMSKTWMDTGEAHFLAMVNCGTKVFQAELGMQLPF